MSMWLRQSTASQEVLLGPFLDDTDGKTAETGLTIANTDIKLWVEGATTEANKNSGGATHIAGGRYYAVLDATDTGTLGKLEVNVHMSGALPVRREFVVLPANVYDSLVLGTDLLDANASQLGGTSQTGRDIGASVLLSNGIGAGQISLSSGTVTVGTNNDKTGYTASTVSDKTGYSLTATTGLGNQTANITGNVSGSVGSVIGAVGSVTGAVGSVTAGVTLTSGERTTLAAAIEAAIINELDGTAVMQAIADLIASDMTTTDLTVAAIASACRDAILNRVLSGNHDTSGTTGKVLQDIVADTNELQSDDTPGALTALQSHGDSTWATANVSGLSTHSAADVVTAMQAVAADFKADVSGLATGISLATLKTLVDKVAVICIGNASGAGTDEEVFTFAGGTATVSPDEAGNRTIVFS